MEKAIEISRHTTGDTDAERRFAPSFRLLVHHELRQTSRDGTLWISVVLLTLLMAYAAFNGSTWIGFQKETIGKALAEESERLRSMRDELQGIDAGEAKPKLFRDPARPGWVGEFLGTRYAVLEPAPLAALSIGQRDLYPYYFQVSTLSADRFINEDEIENPFNLLAGRFDVAFVIVYLFPLFILALGYNLLSAEKESGTLQLALSQPLDKKRLLAAKLMGRSAPVIALVVSLTLGGATLSSADFSNGETVIRLLLLSTGVVVYGLFWFAVTALVNVFGKSSATNAVALAAVWLALAIVVPASLAVVASTVYPVDSRLKFIEAARDKQSGTPASPNDVLERFYVANPDLRPGEADKNDFMPGFYAAQSERDQRMLPLLRSYETQIAEQNRFAEGFRFAAPPLAIQSALNDLAATGFERYRNFIEQVHAFHRDEWQAFFRPKLFRRERLTASDYDQFPKFTFAEELFSAVLQRIFLGLAAILAATIALAAAAVIRLRSFPIAN